MALSSIPSAAAQIQRSLIGWGDRTPSSGWGRLVLLKEPLLRRHVNADSSVWHHLPPDVATSTDSATLTD